VPTAKRLDVKKGKDLVALEELEGRDVACPSMLATKDLKVIHIGSS
jgi:hypothetical protein